MKTICIFFGLLAGAGLANATNQAQSSPDKPARLYVESYTYSEHAEIHPAGQGYNSDGTQTYTFQESSVVTLGMNWTDGNGGNASDKGSGSLNTTGSLGIKTNSWTEDDAYQWGASDWPDLVAGTETFNSTATDTTPDSWSGTGDPPTIARPGYSIGPLNYSGGFLQIGFEHCKEQGSTTGNHTFSDNSGNYKLSQDQVVYSRTADTVMKLVTGGRAMSHRKNLFMLSASAWCIQGMNLKPNLLPDGDYWEWEMPPIWGPVATIDPTQIEIDGKPLGSDGKLWIALPDSDTPVDVTPRVKNKDFYDFYEPTPPKYYLVSRCGCPLQNLARTTVGVGEIVGVYFSSDGSDKTPAPAPSVLSSPITWTTTAGSLSVSTSTCATTLTSPSSAATATVTATVKGQSFQIDFGVIEPTGISSTIRLKDGYNIGQVAAGMEMNVFLQPTTVSFSSLQIMEPGEPTTTTGYFNNSTPRPPSHADSGANRWHGVDCGNNLIDDSHFDSVFDQNGWPIGVLGTYTWPIHPIWEVKGDNVTHPLSGWTDQVFTLYSDGTMRIDKLGHYIIRHTYETYGIAQ